MGKPSLRNDVRVTAGRAGWRNHRRPAAADRRSGNARVDPCGRADDALRAREPIADIRAPCGLSRRGRQCAAAGWNPAQDLRHYRRLDNAPRLRRFLERGPGRTDEMGGDRSPTPCGGTWGCAAPRGELGATRNCSSARRRRASSPHVAGICCLSLHLRREVFGAKRQRETGEGSPPGPTSSQCGLAARKDQSIDVFVLSALCANSIQNSAMASRVGRCSSGIVFARC
jgi:hypothetical protein